MLLLLTNRYDSLLLNVSYARLWKTLSCTVNNLTKFEVILDMRSYKIHIHMEKLYQSRKLNT